MLLAQRTGAYIEGIPAVVWRTRFVVAELASGFSMEVYRARRDDEAGSARKLFEAFMQQRDIPRRSGRRSPLVGWLDASAGDASSAATAGSSTSPC